MQFISNTWDKLIAPFQGKTGQAFASNILRVTMEESQTFLGIFIDFIVAYVISQPNWKELEYLATIYDLTITMS